MKKTNFLHVLLGITTSSALVFSCISEEINDVKGNSETISLVMPSEQTVAFKIGYNVPEGYRVTVTANGTVFLVTNVSTTPPVVPPTGDTASLGFYVILLAVSGLLLVLLSSRHGRRKDNEEK